MHEGASSSTATIAAAACGLANPQAVLDTAQAPEMAASLSGGVVAVLVLAIIFVTIILVVGCLYYFRKPIPFCGACVYDSDFLQVPPPPPKPITATVPPPSAPPPAIGETKV